MVHATAYPLGRPVQVFEPAQLEPGANPGHSLGPVHGSNLSEPELDPLNGFTQVQFKVQENW
jgi:hypothetical protein